MQLMRDLFGVRPAWAGLIVVAAAATLTGATSHTAASRPLVQVQTTPALVISTTGDDATCRRGVTTRPCQTFNRAYQLAECGDLVRINAGAYESQTIVRNSRLGSCSRSVVLQGAGRVYVDRDIRFGSCAGCPSDDAPTNIVLRNVAYKYAIWLWGNARNIVVDGVDGGGININGASNVTVRNSDFGPCNSSEPGNCERVFILDGGTQNILFEQNVVHDFAINSEGGHWECMFATGGTNVVIRKNRFFNCDTYGIRLIEESESDRIERWQIVDNWFGVSAPHRKSAVVIGTSHPGDALFRFNSFIAGQGIVFEGGTPTENVRIDRNVLPFTGCVPGARYSANLHIGGSCDSSDRASVYGYRFDGTRLRVDPAEARALRAVFRDVAEGQTLAAAAKSARGRRPVPAGGWSVRTIRALLADDVYLGGRLGRVSEHAALVTAKRWRLVQKLAAR